jgi:pilus assembly protein FimV
LLKASRVGAVLVSACCFLGANVVWALGLGEIELNSALNERLDAKIDLLDANGLQPAEVLVSLASGEDFERVGVERFFFLTDLRFEVTYGAGGAATVAVSSSQAVTEPYLNFLVEVLWPSGRLLKEYTLLLDPPTFSDAAAPAVSAPRQETVSRESAGRVRRAEESSPSTSSGGTQVQLAPPAEPPTRDPFERRGGELMTDREDTLWKIAARTLPAEDISVQQNMLAIQRLNRNAFIKDNINLLKAGYVLRLPDADEARQLGIREARAEVAAQHQDWRTGTRSEREPVVPQVVDADSSDLAGQLDARAASGSAAPAAEPADGELRIMAGQGDSATGLADQEGGDQQLDAALEESDRLTREVDELTYQLDREKELAVSQLEVKDRQLEIKDQEVAELQTQLAELREQLAAAETGTSQNQSVSQKPQEAWWQSTAVMGSAAGVLVLALVGGLIFARRRREEDDGFYAHDEQVSEPRVEPDSSDEEAGGTLADQGEAADELADDTESYLEESELQAEAEPEVSGAEPDADIESELAADSEAQVPSPEAGDVIAEADIYIAYGRYPQATGLLLGVLEDDPDRNDVRLKLLEIFAETQDQQSFETHMGEFIDRCDDQEALLTARELETRLNEDELEVDQGADADAELDLVSSADAASNVEELELPGVDDTLTDVTEEMEGLEAADDLADAVDVAQSTLDTEFLEVDAETDFELELDSADAEEQGAGDQLGGDLGLDFDPDSMADDELELAELADAGPEPGEALEEPEFESEVATAEDDFDFEEDGDSANTKLDLARAYIDMGDEDGARDILKEVLDEGSAEQQQQAQSLLENL